MKSHFLETPDGAKLHIAEWGEASNALPIVCLAGLTRNFHDFEALAQDLNRHVYAFDYRGRGFSSYAETYTFPQEHLDIYACLAHLNIKRAIFIGTSRGGLHTLQLAAHSPDMVAAAVLNDIGAEVEIGGLIKIRDALSKRGKTPLNYDDGVAALKRMLGDEFPNLPEDQWLFLAKSVWFTENGALKLSYDAALSTILDAITPDMVLPNTWKEFALLAQKPTFLIRGENSQLLSRSVFQRMIGYNKNIHGVEIVGQGHAPIMMGEVNAHIIRFIQSIS